MKLLFNYWKKPLKCWLGIQTPTQISNMLQENSAEELSILNCEWSWNWRGILRLLCTIHSGSYNMEINLSKFLSHLASSGPFWPFYINFGQIYSETGFRTFINFHYLIGLWFPLQRVKKIMLLPRSFRRSVSLPSIFEPIWDLSSGEPSGLWQFSLFPRAGIRIVVVPFPQDLARLFFEAVGSLFAVPNGPEKVKVDLKYSTSFQRWK